MGVIGSGAVGWREQAIAQVTEQQPSGEAEFPILFRSLLLRDLAGLGTRNAQCPGIHLDG